MRAGLVAALLVLVPFAAKAQDSPFTADSDFPAFAGLRGSLAFATSVKTTVPTTPPTALRASSSTPAAALPSIYIGMRGCPYGFKAELEGLCRHCRSGQRRGQQCLGQRQRLWPDGGADAEPVLGHSGERFPGAALYRGRAWSYGWTGNQPAQRGRGPAPAPICTATIGG